MSRLALASVLATAEAGTLAITWSDCGAAHAKVTDLAPLSIQTGSTVTITGTGTVDEAVTSTKFTATVSALGTQLTSCSGDGTKDIVCTLPLGVATITIKPLALPFAPGTVEIPVEVKTSPTIPPSLASIDIHIAADDQSGASLICMDVHTDASVDEPHQYAKGFVRQPRNAAVPVGTITPEMRSAAPAKLDWTETSGAVSSVKDQGQCGSCWAFSATEGIESGVFMTDGKASPALSPQQITSCDTSDGGCNGGDLPTAFDYVEGAGGIDTDSAYPYTSATGRSGSCKSHNNVVSVTGYKYAVPPCEGGSCSSQDEDGLKAALNSFGPLSVCVNAQNFNGYYGGVVASGSCSGAYNQLDHCVQLVGYDTTASTPFWKVKNSWAADWGEAGFIRLPMGENSCGIADEAMYVTATMNGQNTNFLASKVV